MSSKPDMPEKIPLHVSMVEDNRFFRTAWETILRSDPGVSLVGSFASCEDAFRDHSFGESDICLMDIGLPGMSGIEGVIHIRRHHPGVAVIMCTVHDDDASIFDSLCAGAIGYLVKKTEPEELMKALRDASRGGSPMSPSIARRVIASFQTAPAERLPEEDRLTPRELDILQRMALGKSYTTIAGELFLSVEGVRYHIRHIYEKLQVHTKSEAVAQGFRDRLIRPPR
jgi:DNA-binding NarL/FixJ family response regulator